MTSRKTHSSLPLTIGRLARAAGVHVETIRYYERRGLIARPPRAQRGFRAYPSDTVERLRFIKRAQQLGFQLKEIKELLTLGEGQCSNVRTRAEKKRNQIHAQIDDLKALKRMLDRLIRSCARAGTSPSCPIISALSRPAKR